MEEPSVISSGQQEVTHHNSRCGKKRWPRLESKLKFRRLPSSCRQLFSWESSSWPILSLVSAHARFVNCTMLGGQIMVCRRTTLWLRSCRCLRSSHTCSWPRSQQRKQLFTAVLESAGQVPRLPCLTWSRHYGHRRTEVSQMLSSASSQQSGDWESKDIILCRCLGSMTSSISSWEATLTWPTSDKNERKRRHKKKRTRQSTVHR